MGLARSKAAHHAWADEEGDYLEPEIEMAMSEWRADNPNHTAREASSQRLSLRNSFRATAFKSKPPEVQKAYKNQGRALKAPSSASER
jgi:hypothetical protein